MDLRQLQAFLAVVDHGGFTAAARATHTVQSNISTHVARLERQLDATLIDRSTGEPTQEGEAVVTRIRRIQNELTALEADVASLQGAPRGLVRVGVIGTTGRWLLPLLVQALADNAPQIELVVAEGSTSSLSRRIVEGDLDIGVLGLPVDEPDLRTTELFSEDHVVIAPSGHPLTKLAAPISIEQLAQHELLLAAAGTAFRVELDAIFKSASITPKTKLEVDGIRLLASLAFQGFGVAIVPATAAPGWIGGDWERILVDGLGRRAVGLANRRRGMPSVATQATANLIRSIVRNEADSVTGLQVLS
ncbi:MAG: LysR family transcriptional regulator [Acidimicrobiales bacterium]